MGAFWSGERDGDRIAGGWMGPGRGDEIGLWHLG